MPLRLRVLVVGALLLTVGGCMTPSARQQLERFEDRLKEVEGRLATLRKAQEKSAQKLSKLREGLEGRTVEVEELQERVRNQQGTNELLSHRIDQLKERQDHLYSDMDSRLSRLEEPQSGGEVESGAAPVGPGSNSNSAPESATEAYQSALQKVKAHEYRAAATAFERFLKAHSDSKLSPNAQYWLGECYYVLRQFERALVEFNRVLENYPNSRKVPAALLKIGFSFYELDELESAQRALDRVVERFPDSSEARLAQRRLKEIDSGG